MSNSLDPDQDRRSVGPDLGPDCLQRLSADTKKYRIVVCLSGGGNQGRYRSKDRGRRT